MKIDFRDLVAILSVLVAIISMLIVSRNARAATSVNAQNLDLARIRDLRQELAETKTELHAVRQQAGELAKHLTEANERAVRYAQREAEMIRFASMPGTTIEDWMDRFNPQGNAGIGPSHGR